MTRTGKTLRFLVAGLCAAALAAGCGGGGDVEISADNNSVVNDNSTNTGGGGSNNPCANYTDPATNTLRQGSFDGSNCNYTSDFVGENNPLTVDLTIPFISGVHIFEDSLFVGENVDGTDPSVVPPAGGQGPTLRIRAGATLAWTQANDYLLVNRGSQIIAEGSPTAPITLTGFSDAVLGSAGQFQTQLWGGLVLNGNGITNKCSDTQRANNGCHVVSEGKPSNYGGDDNADNSGVLQYVVVKHAGFEVAPGDELNGITFNAVGSGTTVNNVQVYATYDDGVEFFGGAVSVSNLVALYVQDDSIDWADGWVGSVDRALIIHAPNEGQRCIEADNQDPDFNALPLSNGTVRNMTCIISANDNGIHGDAEGPLLRRGTLFAIEDSIIYDGYARTLLSRSGNECFEIDDSETRDRAQAGDSSVKSNLIVCEEPAVDNLNNGDSVLQWVLNTGTTPYPANTNNRVITDSANPNVVVLDGFYTAPAFADETGTAFTVTAEGGGIIGAVSADDDWTENWTFGLNDPSLWILP
ncbi:MAG: hypothetical protein RIB46_00330 [Pseudomonadales bacterium]